MKVQYIKYSSLPPGEKVAYILSVYRFVKILNIEYPDFDNWFYSLFENAYQLKKEREIIICIIEQEIAGLAIIKNTADERKICTLRVGKKYQHNGIGRHLMEMCFELLGNEKPMITMHKSKYPQFSPLLNYYGFDLEQKYRHYYSIFSTELVFNGELPKKKICLNRIELIDFHSIINDFLKEGSYDFEHYINVFLSNCVKREVYRYSLVN